MQIGCPNMENYSPCICPILANHINDNNDISFELHCNGVTIEEVTEVFEFTTAADIEMLQLMITGSTVFITKDIFVNHRITFSIFLKATRQSNENVLLHIHREAFHSSRDFLQEFQIRDYDMRILNFDFLSGFNSLVMLSIMGCNNVNLSSLPPLPSLYSLYISYCTGLNDWTELPQLVNGLENLSLNDNDLSDVAVDHFLKWIHTGPSKNSLTRLCLDYNALTRIPSRIKHFSRLKDITFRYQQNQGFGKLSVVSFPNFLEKLDLSFCNITDIEPDILIPGFYAIVLRLLPNIFL